MKSFRLQKPQSLRSPGRRAEARRKLKLAPQTNWAMRVLLFLAIGTSELLAQQNSARLPLEVVVQDSSGNPVTDLAAGDFEIAVDGRSLPLTAIEFVGKGSRYPRGNFSPPFPAPGDALRSIVILIDTPG